MKLAKLSQFQRLFDLIFKSLPTALTFLAFASSAVASELLYVPSLTNGTVQVVNAQSNATIAQVPVGVSPIGVAVNAAGARAYVTNMGSDTLSVIDTQTNTVVATLAVSSGVLGVAVNRAGTRVFVTANNTVSAIDTTTNTVVASARVGPGALGIAVSPTGNRLYVANSEDGTISVLTAATLQRLGTIQAGVFPYGVAINPSGSRLYVSNYENGAVGSVSVIDTTTNGLISTIPVGAGPTGIAVTPDGTKAYVSNYVSNTLSVISTVTNSVVTTIPVGLAPAGISINAAGTKAYVSNFGGQSTAMSVVDIATDTLLSPLVVGPGSFAFGQATTRALPNVVASAIVTTALPRARVGASYNARLMASGTAPFDWEISGLPTGLVMDPSTGLISGTPTAAGSFSLNVSVGNNVASPVTRTIRLIVDAAQYAYIGSQTTGSIGVIDLANGSTVATVPVGATAFGVAVNAFGSRAYATSLGESTLSVIDTSTNAVISTLALSSGTRGVAANLQGSRVYVAHGNFVSVLDAATNTIVDLVQVGQGAVGVAVSPGGNRIFVTNGVDGTVSVISALTNRVVANIAVGSSPYGLAVSHDGRKLYVANYGQLTGSTVSIIDTLKNQVVSTVGVGMAPVGVTVLPDDRYVYVTNYASSTVSVIDTASNSLVNTLAVGVAPVGIAPNSDGSRVYVANFGAGSTSVSTIDTATIALLPAITTATGPYSLGQFIAPRIPELQVPVIENVALPSGKVGVVYAHHFSALGTAPFDWSMTGLPPGLSFDNLTGKIEGIPIQAGLWVLNVTASNGVNPIAAMNFELTIEGDPASCFTPIGALDRMEVRGGAVGAGDWEWAIGTNTQTAGGSAKINNINWANGSHIKFVYTIATTGQKTLRLINEANQIIATAEHTTTPASPSTNALRLFVTQAAGLGIGTRTRAEITAINEQTLASPIFLETLGNNAAGNQSKVFLAAASSLTNALSVEGRVTMFWSGPYPNGSRLGVTLNAGNSSCAGE